MCVCLQSSGCMFYKIYLIFGGDFPVYKWFNEIVGIKNAKL